MAGSNSQPKHVDVFISGAGPVGLVLAYHLGRLGVSVLIVDAVDKADPSFPMYGRACTLLPRTCEMLDQLDLFDEMAQTGFAIEKGFAYRGSEKIDRGLETMKLDLVKQTFFGLGLNIRLKYSEDIFRARLSRMECVEFRTPWKLGGFTLDGGDEYKVRVSCTDANGGAVSIGAKYIVGCDGANSLTRRTAGIPFVGERTVTLWVRIDGLVKTNVPEARCGYAYFESPTHGHVLWVPLDHGATRIGFVLSDELYAKYGKNMTAEEAVFEAKRACAPWEVEFQRVDWHTVYGIGQYVAGRLQDRERIFLAGDAAHSHSSGSAQGMNTGIHDVVNLGWRLAGVIHGAYKPEVLQGYSTERHAIATQLIENDKIVSALMSHKRPDSLLDDPEPDNMLLLNRELTKQAAFTTGLGISYPPNLLNHIDASTTRSNCAIVPGHRAPDAVLTKPAVSPSATIRLLELTKYTRNFHVLVFTGCAPSAALRALRHDADDRLRRFGRNLEFRTIVKGRGRAVDEFLGTEKFELAFWDVGGEAHALYCREVERGVIVVVRPDGIVGFAGDLESGWEGVGEYLEGVMVG